MEKVGRIILAVATLLVMLGAIFGIIWGIMISHFGMIITCVVLAALFSVFVYFDYKRFFGNKDGYVSNE